MTAPIKKILIVGGGSSGWLSAAYLQRMLNRVDPHRVEITLVESPDLGIIGVGEATVPTLVNTLGFLGVDEADFMRRTHATFKQAIRFENWRDDPLTAPGQHFWHPFERMDTLGGLPMQLALSRRLGEMPPGRFAYDVLAQPWLCDAMRAPKVGRQTLAPYAYHMDAVLMGRYLRELATGRGVVHLEDTIARATQHPDGSIAALHTRSGRQLEADLFIDCSGFASVLLQGVFAEPFESYGDSLFCDRAVAMQVPLNPAAEIKPYTTSTAQKHGWTWEIQLRERCGIGYVYSSAFCSDDDAERELREHIGPRAEGLNARRLTMRVGRTRDFWVRNCVSIGLSGGFIEPLESTGIYLVEMGLKLLLDNLPLHGLQDVCARNFNQRMRRHYDKVRDFIVLHYCLTNREDTEFWRANKHSRHLPDSLRENLELWQHRYPASWDDGSTGNFFSHATYLFILAGMGRLPALDTAYSGFVSEQQIAEAQAGLRAHRDELLRHAPSHRRYLETQVGPLSR